MKPEQREKLKAAAIAADQGGEHIYTNPRDSNNWSNNETWHAAASPAVVLSLIAQVEALTVPQWIVLSDEKPSNWVHVLVALTTGTVVLGVRGPMGWHWDETDDSADQDAAVTHWMPLPAAPTIPAILGTKAGA